jgi:hypothetical protein
LNRLNYRRKIANGGSNFSQRQRPKIKKWAVAILVSGNGQKLKNGRWQFFQRRPLLD